MTQYLQADNPIDPLTVDGTELATRLNRLVDAIDSDQSGNARPATLTAGGIYTKTAAGGVMSVMLYDGTSEHEIGGKYGYIMSRPPAGSRQTITVADAADTPLTLNGATGQISALMLGKGAIHSAVVSSNGYLGSTSASPNGIAWPLTVIADVASDGSHAVARFKNNHASSTTRIDILNADSINRGIGVDNAGNFCVWIGTQKGFFIGTDGTIHAFNATIIPIVSDKRMKTVTSKLDDALDVVNQLNPIKYAWKKGYGEGEQYGFIAQEIGKVKPDALKDAAHEKLKDAKTYNPEFLVPYLVKAVQQLTTQVEELKSQLEGQINA